jgi:hypothetical protein
MSRAGNTLQGITLNFLNKPPPPPKERILTLAFLFPNATDAALNRLVARMSKHKVCHVEVVFEDDMAFSIFAGSSVFFRQRSFSNPDYHLISISVSNAEYQSIYNYCKSAAGHNIKFSDYGMYASYLQPKGCPFLNTGESVRIGSTFCSKIVTEALRDLARWLYRQLQAEYDHLTSDEAIEEGIIVNEYTFTEGGRRFG